MAMDNLRRLRLLFEDFPKNHNLILVGQPVLLSNLDLAVNQDLKSRVTYSVITRRLHDDAMRAFIQRELDRIGLPHGTFTAGATGPIVRSPGAKMRPKIGHDRSTMRSRTDRPPRRLSRIRNNSATHPSTATHFTSCRFIRPTSDRPETIFANPTRCCGR
ncbi:MAG: hypothetical protein WD049_09710, partial [Candidatus Paceibacterota bacterium]